MARFTSIGMPKKSFVASAAEESREQPAAASESASAGQPPAKKRKRRGTRGKDPSEIAASAAAAEKSEKKRGWTRDPDVAKRAKLSAEHSFQRREKRKDERSTNTTCFACRSVGHAARDCPNVLLALEKGGEGSATLLGDSEPAATAGEAQGKGQGMKRKKGKKGGDVVGGNCYRCNGTDHSLKDCPTPLDPRDPHPFATCFICLGTGHLSSLCPSNPGRGIYVNGGSCKVCGSTAHRAKDCPEEAKQRREEYQARPKRGEVVLGTGEGGAGADEDDFMVQSRETLLEAGNDGASKGKKKKHPPANNGQRGKMAEYDTTSSVPRDEPVAAVREVKKVPKSKAKTVSF